MRLADRLRVLEAPVEPDPTSLKEALRSTRTRAGAEQGEMAEQLGVSRQSVSEWERGNYVPPRGMVIAWAVLTGEKPTKLLELWEPAWRERKRNVGTPGRRPKGGDVATFSEQDTPFSGDDEVLQHAPFGVDIDAVVCCTDASVGLPPSCVWDVPMTTR